MTSRSDADGFATLEFIIGFVILSISLAITLQSISQAALLLRRADQDEQMSGLLRQVLAEQVPQALKQTGDAQASRGGPGWQLEVRPTEGSGRIVRVEIALMPNGGGRPYRYTMLHTLPE